MSTFAGKADIHKIIPTENYEGFGSATKVAARAAVLRSWGIETAAEIDEAKIAEIPEFGRRLTDPLEVRKIDRELATRRTKLVKELRTSIAALEKKVHAIRDDRAAC